MAEDVQYFLIDGRPVKWKPAIAGGSVTLVWDEAAGQFVADLSLVDRLLVPDEQVTSVDQITFEQALATRRPSHHRRRPHPARVALLEPLLAWTHSREPIDEALRTLTENGMHWFILGTETVDGRQQVILVESTSLGVACVVGDGATFGEVVVPDEVDLQAIASRYGLRAF
jgi:hypothetical protein